jgi:hypothetical protein
MKNKLLLPLLLAFLGFFIPKQSSNAQNCVQVEILYDEPDCYLKRPNGQGSVSDPKACKPISACEDQPYEYESSITGLGYTYLWSATGPSTVTFTPYNTNDVVTTVWSTPGIYTLTLVLTDGSGNTSSSCVAVDVKEKPVANFSFGPNSACANSTVNFTNLSTFTNGAMSYQWSFGDNTYSNQENPSHVYAAQGNYNVCLIVSSFITVTIPGLQGQHESQQIVTCCSDTLCQTVIVKPGTLELDCISTVCAGTTQTYTVNCNNTTWGIPIGGTVMSSTGNQITVQWGSGAVQGQITAQCGNNSCQSSWTIPIIPATPVPVGNLVPCLTDITSYTLPILPGTFYNWRLTNITTSTDHTPLLYTQPDNNTVWINWNLIAPNGTDNYLLTVDLENEHICCQSMGTITITPRGAFSSFFDQTICLGDPANLSVSPSTGTFNWVINPSAGVSPSTGTGPTFGPAFTIAGNYTATVTETANSYCNSPTPQTVNITVLPATPATPAILGPTNVCLGSNVSYSMATAAPPGYHYTWTIPLGAGVFMPGSQTIATGNSATINWSVLSGTISVVLERNNAPFCPSSSSALVVNPVTIIGNVSGPSSVCVDASASYNITGGNLPPGEPVNWTLTPANAGTITAGQGTSTATILWHGTGGAGPWGPVTLSASTACGAPVSQSNIIIYPKFTFTLSQTNDICTVPNGATLTASSVANSPTYLWNNGATTNPINVTTPGIYTCQITNAGGCTYTEDIEVKDPFWLQTNCTVGTCNGNNMEHILNVYIGSPGSGSFTYQWFSGTFPNGTAISLPVTTGITINNYTATTPGSYYVTVDYGICQDYVPFNVPLICCPDINNPQITSVVQNSCYSYTYTGTVAGTANGPITWYFGDGQSAVGVSGVPINHVYDHAGIYCVEFCVGAPNPNPTGCTGNCALTTVVVPIEAFFITQVACNGCVNIQNTSINLSSFPATVSYTWTHNGNPFSTAANPTFCPANILVPGVNTIVLTMTYSSNSTNNITCQSTASQTINYTPLSINASPLPACTGVPVSFSSVPGGFASYSWAFGDGSFAFTPSTTHIYNTAAPSITYSLQVIDQLGNICTSTGTSSVLVGSNCTIVPAYICGTGTATLTAPAGTAYLWQEFVAGNWVAAAGTNTNQTYTTGTPGQFRVQVTNANGCVCTSNSVQVLAVPKPDARIQVSPSRKLCAPGGPVTLYSAGASGLDQSQWYINSIAPGNQLGGPSSQTIQNVASTTTFFLVVTSQYGCTASCSITVEVNPLPPPFGITGSPLPLCSGQVSTLVASSPAAVTSWNTGQQGNTLSVTAAGNYIATAVNPITGCARTANIVVNERPSVALYPHWCDDISCDCHNTTNPFAIYAPRPLLGPSAPAYTAKWYNYPAGTQILTGITGGSLDYTNLPTGVLSGSYYIELIDPNTNCIATSEPYTVNVENCIDCDCANSSFAELTYSVPGPRPNDPPVVTPFDCGKSYALRCNVPVTINGLFNCSPEGCPSEIQILITPPSGPPITGTLPFTFSPNLVGTYTFQLIGFCGGIQCSICEFTNFIVDCPPLSVNILSFTGKQQANKINLHWVTAMEFENDNFMVEKSADGFKFELLGQVKSKSGSNIEKISYTFDDPKPSFGVNYYRLKARDIHGAITASNIIAINYTDHSQAHVYPNPGKGQQVTFEYGAVEAGSLQLDWYDLLGRKLYSQQFSAQKGSNTWQLPIGGLAKGKYMIKLTSNTDGLEVSSTINFEKLE